MTRLVYISVCLRTRQDTISYSFDIYSSEIGTSIDGYGNERREWSILGLLLVLVCRSVPPGRLSILLLRWSFYTLRRPRSANQRSRISMRHLADQSAIASCIETNVQRATSD